MHHDLTHAHMTSSTDHSTGKNARQASRSAQIDTRGQEVGEADRDSDEVGGHVRGRGHVVSAGVSVVSESAQVAIGGGRSQGEVTGADRDHAGAHVRGQHWGHHRVHDLLRLRGGGGRDGHKITCTPAPPSESRGSAGMRCHQVAGVAEAQGARCWAVWAGSVHSVVCRSRTALGSSIASKGTSHGTLRVLVQQLVPPYGAESM